MSAPVISFGEVMLRLSPPGFERLLQTPQLTASFGGSEANVAIALSCLGTPAAFATILPDDNPVADAALGELRRFGVETSAVFRGEGRMGICYIEPGANQRPSRVTYDRASSAIALARAGDIDWRRVFDGRSWFHISGVTPALSQPTASLALESVRIAHESGLTVSCDLNFRRRLWKWGKTAIEVMPDLLRRADIAIANEEDIEMSLGIQSSTARASGQIDFAHSEDLTNCVLATYPNLRIVAMTLRHSSSASRNHWSACLRDGDGFLTSRRYEIANIVDRVGAGDSFAAGLIYGLRALEAQQDALEFATALGCLKHSVPGDFSRFTVADVNALLAGDGSGRIQR
jgi:2-dehydro-3-deoxygluconokinase